MDEFRGKTILLVEDEAIIALTERLALEGYGYVVVTAGTGEKAIAMFGDDPMIDLVLMDIDLGYGMDGIETAVAILALRAVPIVFLSSHTETQIVTKTESITSYGYVVKNSGITVLDASIKMAFKLFAAHRDIHFKNMEMEAAYEEMQVSNEELIDLNDDLNAANDELVDSRNRLVRSEASVSRKLKAVLEPEGDIGELKLSDILDADALQSMMSDFSELTNICSAIVDMSGKVLVEAGWQDICTKFHRCHPETRKNCNESDVMLSDGVPPGTFKVYRCKNGMWDIVTPIMMGGRHIGNIFVGQFFYDDDVLDLALFSEQARRFGFDEAEYLAALRRVPRFSHEHIDAAMAFYAKLAEMVSTLSFSAIKLSRALATGKRTQDMLVKSEERYRNAQEIGHVGNWEYDIATTYFWGSDEAKRIYGFDPDASDFSTEEVESCIVDRERVHAVLVDLIERDAPYDIEFEIRPRDSSESKYIWSIATVSRDESGMPLVVTGVIHDITARRRVEESLRASESRYDAFMANLPAAAFVKDRNGDTLFANQYLMDLLPPQVWAGKKTEELFDSDVGRRMVEDDLSALARGSLKVQETLMDRDGVARTFETIKFPINIGGEPVLLGGIAVDITDRKLAEESVQRLLREKELILKEVHHRVKNNLTIMSTLLTLQAQAYDNAETKTILQDAARRVQSMSILYDKLYRSENSMALSIRAYIPALMNEIMSIFPGKESIRLETSIEDIILGSKLLTNLGIIVNELITNAMKYAFAGRDGGTITVTASKAGNRVSFAFGDDGIGIPESVAPESSSGFGMQLIAMLVNQMDGALAIDRTRGTKFSIEFDA